MSTISRASSLSGAALGNLLAREALEYDDEFDDKTTGGDGGGSGVVRVPMTRSEYAKMARWLSEQHPGWEDRCGLEYSSAVGRWVPVKNPRDAKKESGGKNGDAAGPEGSESVVIGAGGPHRV